MKTLFLLLLACFALESGVLNDHVFSEPDAVGGVTCNASDYYEERCVQLTFDHCPLVRYTYGPQQNYLDLYYEVMWKCTSNQCVNIELQHIDLNDTCTHTTWE